MLKESLDQLFEYVAKYISSDEITLGKKEYQKTTGEIYDDDKTYNIRMALFLEWYLLDYSPPGCTETVLEKIIKDNPSGWTKDRLEIYKAISNNTQALFQVKKVREHSVVVLNLFADDKIDVKEENSKLIFRKNDIFQGRIVHHKGKLFFTEYFCFHPKKTHKFIKAETKVIYLIQKGFKKELLIREKEFKKYQRADLKICKLINKINNKIESTGVEAKQVELRKELLVLEENANKIRIESKTKEEQIHQLKNFKIKIEVKNLISDLINKLAYMNLKWERSRQIEISDIYKN